MCVRVLTLEYYAAGITWPATNRTQGRSNTVWTQHAARLSAPTFLRIAGETQRESKHHEVDGKPSRSGPWRRQSHWMRGSGRSGRVSPPAAYEARDSDWGWPHRNCRETGKLDPNSERGPTRLSFDAAVGWRCLATMTDPESPSPIVSVFDTL